MYIRLTKKATSPCFRPLSGNYISQYAVKQDGWRRTVRVSVPCRGTTFLNMENFTQQSQELIKFPSPVGELHFSMESLSTGSETRKKVSVPCRGTTFLNSSSASVCVTFSVSVPCRGTTFLNGQYEKHIIYMLCKFPSPVGELHFSMLKPLCMVLLSACFRPLSGNYISQYHPCNPATSLGSWSGLRGKNIFGKINKMHLLKSAANSVFKPCAAKSKQIFSFIKKYQFHIVPSYILFPDSGYISRYVVKPSFLYLYSAYDFVAHLFCQRYLLLFQYLLFRQT